MFTYDINSTSTSFNRSWVRLRIGDTSSGSVKLQDAEIDALLDIFGNRYLAAAAAAETIAGSFSRQSDKQIGRLRIAQSQTGKQYIALASQLRREASLFAGAYAGGLSVAEKDTDRADTDLVQPESRRGEFNNPGIALSTDE